MRGTMDFDRLSTKSYGADLYGLVQTRIVSQLALAEQGD